MIDIGGTKQLFADDELIDSMTHVFQVLNPGPEASRKPLIASDRAWEESPRLQVYGTVLHAPEAEGLEQFRLWYVCRPPEYGDADHAGLLLAQSADGIHWKKPGCGIAALNGSVDNNALWVDNSRHWVGTNGLCYDPDDADAARRYKLLGFLGADQPESRRFGYGALFSPDGVRWTAHKGNPVLAYDHISVCEVATTIYNEQSVNPRREHPLDRHRYYGSVKYSSWMGAPIRDGSFGYMRRSAGIMTSDDYIHWSPNHLVLQPDELDDFLARQRIMAASPVLQHNRPDQQRAEFYGMPLMPCGDILLGLLWVLDASSSVRLEGGNQAGPVHVQLAGSRDLRRWQRLGERMPLLAPGAPDEWDCGSIYTVNRPIVVGDEIWLYYCGSNGGHAGGSDAVSSIGLATWDLDGFVSINANHNPGTLMTKRLRFSGDRLIVNANAAGGELAIALLDEEGSPIPGFGLDECVPFRGDSVRHEIAWQGGPSCAGPAGRLVRLSFRMRNARLYSFVFSD